MKVAFDVQGTLQGMHSDRVVALFKWFESKGCEMYIWSYGGAGMARGAANEHSLTAKCIDKISRGYMDDISEGRMDVCVDDDRSAGATLSSKNCIYVHEIPHPRHEEKLEAYLKGLEEIFFKEKE